MNNYCLNQCPIGQEYKKQVLEYNDSVFDAVSDVQRMLEQCMKTCKLFNQKENLDDED